MKYFRSTNQGFIILYQIRILILKLIFSGVPSGTIVSPAAVRRQQAGPEVSTTPKAETPSKGVKRGRGRGRKSISVVSPAVDVRFLMNSKIINHRIVPFIYNFYFRAKKKMEIPEK